MAGNKDGGGQEKHFVDMVNGLASRGHSVTAIASGIFRKKMSKNVNFIEINLGRSRNNPLALIQLYNAIKKVNPDIIHAQANKSGFMMSRLKRWISSPVLVTIHNQKNNLKFTKKLDAVICVSDRIKNTVPKEPKYTIYNGIPPVQKLTQESRIKLRRSFLRDETDLLWLAVGRFVPAKGFDILIKAFKNVKGHLIIVGDGPDYQTIKNEIKKNELEEKITLLGFRDDVTDIMQSVDAFVMSSRKEGCPYVLLESLLSGTPVISTDVSITREVLGSELVCPTEDPSALTQLMNQFSKDNPAHARAMEFAQENFTLDKMISSTEEIYYRHAKSII